MVTILKPSLPQVRKQPLGVGEAFLIPGENLIPLHIVDIQMDGIAGNPQLAQHIPDILHFFLRLIAPARLMVAQSPKLRKGRSTRKGGVFCEDLPGGYRPL